MLSATCFGLCSSIISNHLLVQHEWLLLALRCSYTCVSKGIFCQSLCVSDYNCYVTQSFHVDWIQSNILELPAALSCLMASKPTFRQPSLSSTPDATASPRIFHWDYNRKLKNLDYALINFIMFEVCKVWDSSERANITSSLTLLLFSIVLQLVSRFKVKQFLASKKRVCVRWRTGRRTARIAYYRLAPNCE